MQAGNNGTIMEIFEKMEENVRFQIADGSVDRNGNQRKVNGYHAALFDDNGKGDYIGSHIFMTWQNLEPLLKMPLTNSQRLVQQFNIAQTVGACPDRTMRLG
jgi:hypothetical protein